MYSHYNSCGVREESYRLQHYVVQYTYIIEYMKYLV